MDAADQAIEELIRPPKEMRPANGRGEEPGRGWRFPTSQPMTILARTLRNTIVGSNDAPSENQRRSRLQRRSVPQTGIRDEKIGPDVRC